jgi:hypothetical protein
LTFIERDWGKGGGVRAVGTCPLTPHLFPLQCPPCTALVNNSGSCLSKLQHITAIAELANGELETLDCKVCRKIADHDEVRRVPTLIELRFNDCGQIPNIQFLNDLPNLTGFRFVDTNVLDGDLTPCLRLDSVGFFGKKHYSHTPEEVDAIIASREQTR